MKCLGLDIGSSTIKGAVLDLAAGQVESLVRQSFPDPISGLPPGRFEIVPAEVVARAERVLLELLDCAPDAQAVFCSAQMSGLILVDARGHALTNYLSWRDQRALDAHPEGGNYLDAMRPRWTSNELAELGNELKPGTASSLLFWLSENRQLPRAAVPATIGDFALSRLCNVVPSMEPTQAIGLLNLATGTWHTAAFERLGIEGLVWPAIADHRRPIGHWRVRGREVPVYPSLGDQQCALRGVDLEADDLSINISTGSQISRLTDCPTPGNYQTRPYFDGRFLNTITHLPAGRSLNALVDLLTELARAQDVTLSNPWEYIARQAAASDGHGLQCDLSFFAGPLGENGSLSGITTENLTVGNLFHAAFRQMADNYARCADWLCPERSWRRLALSGGLTQSVPVLRRLIEQRFAVPVRESTASEETLLGLVSIARSTLQ
jgi:sugar (pentulose or hexulose) kinase